LFLFPSAHTWHKRIHIYFFYLEKQEVSRRCSQPNLYRLRALKQKKRTHERRGKWEDECGVRERRSNCLWVPVRGYPRERSRRTPEQAPIRDDEDAPRARPSIVAATDSLSSPLSAPSPLGLHAVLQLKLQQRRTREELVSQGIMPRKSQLLSSNVLYSTQMV